MQRDEEKANIKDKIEILRNRLATAYGASNYYFYLKNNISTKTKGGK